MEPEWGVRGISLAGDISDAPPRWWQTRWFVIVATLLTLVPLLWPTIPPLVDLPGHMGRYRVQLSLDTAPWLRQWYDFKWSLIGNLGVDLLIIPFAKLFGLEPGVKLIVMAIPALTVTGLLWIAREVHGRIPPTALFALPLAYCYPFQFGFVNFALSMALAFNAFAFWLCMARCDAYRLRTIFFVPLSCLIWLSHAFGWGVLGVLIFSAEFIRARDAGERWPMALFRGALNCLPLALPFLMMALWRGGQGVGGRTAEWFNWSLKAAWLVAILRDRWQAFDIAAISILFFVLLGGFRNADIEYSRKLGVATLLLFAIFAILPGILFGSDFADMRLAPFALAIALLTLRPRVGVSLVVQNRVAMAAMALFIMRIIGQTYSYYLYDQRFGRELLALDHVPVGARLVSFVGNGCQFDWQMNRLVHLPAMGLVRRLAFSNEQWALPGAQLLSIRSDYARNFNSDPSQLVYDAKCPAEFQRSIDKSLTSFPRDAFDYVWLIAPPSYSPRSAAGLVPIWRSGSSVLFRVNH